jgi:dihydrofolate reductase
MRAVSEDAPMGRLIYSMGVSLDGFIAAPGDEIDWTAPDPELFGFHTERVRELGAHICGRRLYETMVYWETADREPGVGEPELEFARIWQALPKVVFSTTLDRVEGNTRLAQAGPAEELARLREAGGGDIGIGGAGLAAAFAKLDLIDEYGLFVYPVVLGAGTPFFPSLDRRLELELVETRTFGARIVYERYVRAR